MRRGRAYELPTSALPTSAKESSSWRGLPTPRATDGSKGGPNQRGSRGDLMLPSAVARLPTPRARDAKGADWNPRGHDLNASVQLLPTPTAALATGGQMTRGGDRSDELLLGGIAQRALLATPTSNLGTRGGSQPPEKRKAGGHSVSLADQVEHQGPAADTHGLGLWRSEPGQQGRRPGSADSDHAAARVDWGKYATAIAIWEALTGPAPAPVEPGAKTGMRLAPRFVEWMQGLAPGWATALEMSRRGIFRLLGNTVVPQQATAALQHLNKLRKAVGR